MPKQNVYDNDAFFDHFRDCRNNEVNFNDCIETPILFAMLPDLHGKTILDIGGQIDFDIKNSKMDDRDAIYYFVSNIINL